MGGTGKDEVARKADGNQAGPGGIIPGATYMFDAVQCTSSFLVFSLATTMAAGLRPITLRYPHAL